MRGGCNIPGPTDIKMIGNITLASPAQHHPGDAKWQQNEISGINILEEKVLLNYNAKYKINSFVHVDVNK
jgi:hypothetical protein